MEAPRVHFQIESFGMERPGGRSIKGFEERHYDKPPSAPAEEGNIDMVGSFCVLDSTTPINGNERSGRVGVGLGEVEKIKSKYGARARAGTQFFLLGILA